MKVIKAVCLSFVLSGCVATLPIGATDHTTITVDGHEIRVGRMGSGGWHSSTVGHPPYPPETRISLISAMEKVSGCAVIRETITGSNNVIRSDVRC